MIVIIDYGMGNLGSIRNMIKKAGFSSEITSDRQVIRTAERIILPGVGHFDKAMSNLENLGLKEVILEKAAEGIPLLGICLGMQLLAESSEEGILPGLGLIPGHVVKFRTEFPLKVPHMGWNLVQYDPSCKLFEGFDAFGGTRFYFVHSYHFVCDQAEDSCCTTNYGGDFTSAVWKNNVYGVQFHPEKSHKFGLNLLKNFVTLT